MNSIGLENSKAELLAVKLNSLLADYMMFYQNTRGLHWNIRGEKFFELHLKFEELYTALLLKVDEVAERILTLGANPLHTFDDFTATSSVRTVKNVTTAQEAIQSILESFKIILIRQRELLSMAAGAGDEGTNALMSDYIREQEKLVWMYSAYLNK